MFSPTAYGTQKINAGLKEPQGPPGHPLLRNTIEFQKDRLAFISRIAQEYGTVARYRLGNVTFYQVNHPDGVQRVLQENNHNYIKGAMFDPFRKTFGEGLFMSEGATWLRQRRLMQPAFHRQRVAGFGNLMTEAGLRLADRWESAVLSGRPLDIASEMTHLTMEVVTRAMFNMAVQDEDNAISRAITVVLENVAYRFEVPFYPPVSIPTPRNRRYLAALQELDKIIYGIIAERRKEAPETPDLLSLLMEARDADTGDGMSDKQLRDELLTIFIAGHETTATTLSWVWYALSTHPEIERRLRAELEQILAGRVPTVADLPNLDYNRMVIEETMRLYPPAWITNRSSLAEDEICGYHIPARGVVALSPYVIHRHPDFWENPEGFDPERFNPERSAGRPRFAYFPFGGGPHQCIGQGFAMVEAQLVLATLAQRFRLHLLPGRPVAMKAMTTLRPADGLWMTVHGA